ncbi:CBS domain-containing protein [Priestia megaterium]|uniref:CBS domain-containing protein n=1 Tax=Priestia megaterium TaxID=1404 RepID=UPI001C21B4E9|nr:CBS domain-containing protein [Priestia megaterium]MBU8688901.1 CBS domain-containing protein [Priestia megaterium]
MNITEVMTSNVDKCISQSTCSEVAEKMKQLDVGVIPVCENNKLVGLVTDRDLVIKGLANNMEANSPISDLITTDVITGTKKMTIDEATNLMSQHQIRRLPIVENDQLVGIVSLGDLAVDNQANQKAGRALEDISVPAQPSK